MLEAHHHLLAGVNNELLPNPIECSRLLISNTLKAQHDGELIAVDWHGSAYVELPDIVNDISRSEQWSCKCPRISIDEMRKLKVSGGLENENDPVLGFSYKGIALVNQQLSSWACQIRESGLKMTRKKLMRLVGQARKFKHLKNKLHSNIDQQAVISKLYNDCSYTLESLTNDINSWLVSLLNQIALLDVQHLQNLLGTVFSGKDDEFGSEWVRGNLQSNGTSLPIGARLSELNNQRDRGRSITSSERDSSANSSEDSGISLIVNLADEGSSSTAELRGRRAARLEPIYSQLERSLLFRSSQAFSNIITYSCNLFQALLKESHLMNLKLSTRDWSPVSLSQLKLFACVECQKLRAKLRFEWLAKCLWLAFEDLGEVSTKRLPSIRGHDHSDYLDALARLMAHLLRRHFLVEALDLWIQNILQLLQINRDNKAAKLTVPVYLSDQGDRLEVSSSDGLLGETLIFVCDELASACSRLPRLECQLRQEQVDSSLAEMIVTLSLGDSLLADKKAELSKSISLFVGRSQSNSWLSGEYLQIIQVLNEFRSGNTKENHDKDLHQSARFEERSPKLPATQAGGLIGLEICNHLQDDGNFRRGYSLHSQLELTCRQIEMLNKLEFRLRCELEIETYFGQLVQLDLRSLNERLIKIVNKERLLLIKLKSDEIVKLMEQLRLQFDELEINIDIATAIEDYVNERWQVKQTQQLNLEQQLLLDNDDNESNPDYHLQVTSGPADLEQQQEEQQEQEEQQDHHHTTSKQQECEEDEFLNALVSNNNPNVAHLFAMSNSGGPVPPEQERQLGGGAVGQGAGRRAATVAPLVECRLLLDRYKYLNRFVRDELKTFVADLEFVLSAGLDFLCEYPPCASSKAEALEVDQLDADQLELLSEISLRTKEFSLVMSEALKRLELTRRRLIESASMRAGVLSRTILEFNWLMLKLGQRRLEPLPQDATGDTNIKQLDFIQESSSWSQRLEMRFDFLHAQNDLLKRELNLLLVECQRELDEFSERLPDALQKLATTFEATSGGRADSSFYTKQNLLLSYEHEFQVRTGVLELWRPFTSHVNRFWRVLESFETQQVKWLNSDAKKLEYAQVASDFELNFARRLKKLHAEVSQNNLEDAQCAPDSILLDNIQELKRRLERFRRVCLPMFKFLTNKHLTQEHWQKLDELLLADENDMSVLKINATAAPSSTGLQQRVCTTVAQLLEQLTVGEEAQQRLVGLLDEMSRKATIEHELSKLIASEVKRCRLNDNAKRQSLKSQLKSLEVCAHLDSWSENELTMAASRFIKLKLGHNGHQRKVQRGTDIDDIARKLVACHSAIRRYQNLSGHLNLDMAQAPCGGHPNDSKPQQVVVLGCKARQVDASLLIEFLRLFTESWLASETKLYGQFDKISVKLAESERHLAEMNSLLGQVEKLKATDLELATRDDENRLAKLQRDSVRLELEREILATRESAALERQREALRARDVCVRQISERAIPALRAARRALDCLGEGESLRALRSYRPSPPMAVRLVIEAVCLLRNVCSNSNSSELSDLSNFVASSSASSTLSGSRRRSDRQLQPRPQRSNTPASVYRTSPEHRFDHMKGQIIEDYWPTAWRTLNGIHSSQFLADLRQVGKRTIPRKTMYLIRRKYLSRPEFNVISVGRISKQAALLARWLIAVDVFDRVLSIVRPNYEAYVRSEENLRELLASVTQSRQQIDSLGRELDQLEESISIQVERRVKLVDLIEECSACSGRLEATRLEVIGQIESLHRESACLHGKFDRVAQRCLWRIASLVYLDALPRSEMHSVGLLIRLALSSSDVLWKKEI